MLHCGAQGGAPDSHGRGVWERQHEAGRLGQTQAIGCCRKLSTQAVIEGLEGLRQLEGQFKAFGGIRRQRNSLHLAHEGLADRSYIITQEGKILLPLPVSHSKMFFLLKHAIHVVPIVLIKGNRNCRLVHIGALSYDAHCGQAAGHCILVGGLCRLGGCRGVRRVIWLQGHIVQGAGRESGSSHRVWSMRHQVPYSVCHAQCAFRALWSSSSFATRICASAAATKSSKASFALKFFSTCKLDRAPSTSLSCRPLSSR